MATPEKEKSISSSQQRLSLPEDAADLLTPGGDTLSKKHREEILKQYDLPKVSVNLFTLLKYGDSLDFVLQIVGSLFSVAGGAALPLMTILIGNLTNVFGGITNPGALSVTTITTTAYFNSQVHRLALILVYLGIGVFFATYIGSVCWIITGERISRRIRVDYLRAVLRQNIAFFDRVGAGEITNRVSHDGDLLQDGISDKLALTLFSLGTFCSGFVIAYVRDWKFALILSCFLPTMIIVVGFGGRMVAKSSRIAMMSYSAAATVAEEVLSSVRTAQAFGTEDKLAVLYNGNLGSAQKAGIRKAFAMAFLLASLFSLRYLLYGLAFWEGSRLEISGDLNVGKVINVLFAILIGCMSIVQMAPRIQAFTSCLAAAQKIFQTLRRVPSIDSFDEGGEKPEHIEGNIEFKNVSFVYPSRPEVTVLKDVSFSIPSGKFTAIVGASGSGKSTVIHLIERFYDPVEGSITLDGHDLKSLNVQYLRKSLSLVSQEPTLFATSIYENICDGINRSLEADLNEEERRKVVQRAATDANADEFIQNLPDGYDTIVGERGFLLSGGQKQRIAIARAIVSNPKVLLLDEATSALDTTSERVVQDALEKVSTSRTTVCIAHRLSTIRNADNIIVMARGEIAEQGNHQELMAHSGIYRGLVEAQRISSEDQEGDTFEFDEEEEEKENALVQRISSHDTKDELHRAATKASTVFSEKPVAPEKKYTNFQLIREALKWNKGEYKWMSLGWVAAVFAGAAQPAQALLFAYLVTALLLPTTTDVSSRADFLSAWWILIAGVEFCAFFGQHATFGFASEKMVRRVRFESLRRMLRQEIAFFDTPEHSTGKLTNTLSTDATAMSGLSGNNLASLLTFVVDLTSVIIVAIAFAWKLGLVGLSVLPVQILCGYFKFSMQNKLTLELRQSYAQSANVACEQVAAIRTVAALNREERVIEDFVASLEAPVHAAMIKTMRSTLWYGLSQTYMFFSLALIFWYGSTQLATGEYSITQFFIALMSLTVGGNTAGMFITFAGDIVKAKAGALSVTRLLGLQPRIDSWSTEGKRIQSLERGHIKFEDVHFRYPTRMEVPILRGLNLEIKPGQYVALVGPSGCGKTTCVSLLERFYDPLIGRILVDDVPITDYNLSDYRKCIALVSQEPTLYQGTVRFNILLGSTELNPTQEEIDEACKGANIYEFIQSLPEGYDTLVGSKGMALSGGQKQRIAIARALIRNPKILLLDEATSALDSESEHVVQSALDNAAQGRTTVAIAHRLSTIQKADMIYVFDGGRIVERGRHEDLVHRKGRYYEMVKLQELEKVNKTGRVKN